MFYKRNLYKGQLVRASALFIRDRYSGYLVVSLINHTWYIYIYLSGNFSSPLRQRRRRSCPGGSPSGATSTRTASSHSSTPSCIACPPDGSGPTTDFSSE